MHAARFCSCPRCRSRVDTPHTLQMVLQATHSCRYKIGSAGHNQAWGAPCLPKPHPRDHQLPRLSHWPDGCWRTLATEELMETIAESIAESRHLPCPNLAQPHRMGANKAATSDPEGAASSRERMPTPRGRGSVYKGWPQASKKALS